MSSGQFLFSQDIHFTQFQGTTLNINPAVAGATECDQCFTGQFRRQWRNVPVDYRTFSGTYEHKFRPRRENAKGWFGGGILFNYDIAGDSRMSTTDLGLVGTYVRKINNSNVLSGGIQLAGTQRAFDLDDLEFDDQWAPYKGLSSTTGESFADLTVRFAGLSGGLNWAYAPVGKRTRLNFGAAGYHLNRPTKSFKNDVEIRHDMRFAFYGIGIIPVTAKLDIMFQALRQIQGPHSETVLGGYLRGHLNQRPTHETALQIGLLYRANEDMLAPAIGLLWKQWEAGLTYDINISNFEIATNNQGGPEAYVKYCIKPPLAVKPCPICPSEL